MYENSVEAIKKAQSGDKHELERIIRDNNRINMEHSKKIQPEEDMIQKTYIK